MCVTKNSSDPGQKCAAVSDEVRPAVAHGKVASSGIVGFAWGGARILCGGAAGGKRQQVAQIITFIQRLSPAAPRVLIVARPEMRAVLPSSGELPIYHGWVTFAVHQQTNYISLK
jgi:hypothetical protein